jgi:hypothetical protein
MYFDPDVFWVKIPRCHADAVLLSTKHCLIKQVPKHVYLISKGESSKRNKINSEITLIEILSLLYMKFP